MIIVKALNTNSFCWIRQMSMWSNTIRLISSCAIMLVISPWWVISLVMGPCTTPLFNWFTKTKLKVRVTKLKGSSQTYHSKDKTLDSRVVFFVTRKCARNMSTYKSLCQPAITAHVLFWKLKRIQILKKLNKMPESLWYTFDRERQF